ncbi:hypothetical protein [Candidatus Cryosericum septentrionale]|jgi:FMN phosphatase YigB (HAD superfamily)|uniref:HAD family hydrolase n=1 Tax=Candidatus Cryosericum septentrionale TaxID=2290913 RepID=A0A398DQC7_9BACT|nr:hypothetical protein [Candidatus Cryosericum septentrionale]RIE17130.1 hypothetical protein SMC1_03080 [Candidatus Cryosericum septentrionale]
MKTFLFDLDGTLLAANENDFMHAYFGELTRALHGLLPAEGLARNILAATARMQADTSPGSSNLVKFRREFEALYQGVDQQAVWDRIMEFYATTFDGCWKRPIERFRRLKLRNATASKARMSTWTWSTLDWRCWTRWAHCGHNRMCRYRHGCRGSFSLTE